MDVILTIGESLSHQSLPLGLGLLQVLHLLVSFVDGLSLSEHVAGPVLSLEQGCGSHLSVILLGQVLLLSLLVLELIEAEVADIVLLSEGHLVVSLLVSSPLILGHQLSLSDLLSEGLVDSSLLVLPESLLLLLSPLGVLSLVLDDSTPLIEDDCDQR